MRFPFGEGTTLEYALLISIISVVFAIYAGQSNLRRNQRHDDHTRSASDTRTEVRLEHIAKSISGIEHSLETILCDNKKLRERVIVVEESSKQAHKRIDGLEGRRAI